MIILIFRYNLFYAGGRGNKRNNKQDKLLKFYIKVLPDFIHCNAAERVLMS